MSDSLFSPSWYRVAELKPRLRGHAEIHRHDYRGKVWFVLQDHAAGRSHRFSPAAYRFIGMMNGRSTVQQLWDAINEEAGDQAPTQDEVIRLLGQLHAADAMICDVTPDSRELFRRYQRQERMKLKQRFWTPMAIRIPLFDPERFLQRTLPLARLFLNRYTAVIWLLVVIAGIVLASVHWSDLSENIIDRALTPQNLILLWFVYPVVKALHELGHAYTAKMSGGEVHEIGIMFLVFMPVPYVDVSSAWGFRDKRRRMLVGAAGIAVEMFLGALALFVWLSVEPGVVHVVAYNVMLISGVSTLLFNGNPLLRFDGYYVLADALEIPNLGSRSNKYLGYLVQRYLFRVKDAESPADSAGECFWFVVYGIAAFIYRMFIMFVIILYVGGKFFTIGIALAIWATITQIFIPMGKNMAFLFKSPRLKRNRGRSVVVSLVMVSIVVGLLFVLPAPLWTLAEGVTWPSDKSQVRAEADGFITELLVEGNSQVQQGQPIIRTRDPLSQTRVKKLELHRKQLEIQLMAMQTLDRVQADIVREELKAASENLERAREQVAALVINSPRDGIFFVPKEPDQVDRFVRKGEIIAYVTNPDDHTTVRAAVSQDDIGLVREHVRKVDVRSASWSSRSYPSEIAREIHGGTHMLPTAALGTTGGGPFATDPSDREGRKTLERVFEIEINLPPEGRTEYLGTRMHVRFDHGFEPLGLQAWRALRQLFLRRFGV
jgi:putative peptide zinc metalloprotease protein